MRIFKGTFRCREWIVQKRKSQLLNKKQMNMIVLELQINYFLQIIFLMGNTFQNENYQEFEEQKWIIANKSKNIYEDYNNSELTFKNKITGQKLDRYAISFNSSQEQEIYKMSCIFRLNSNFLPKVKYISRLVDDHFCGQVVKYYVYIEHFPNKLRKMKKLQLSQYHYILWNALNGFGQLFEQKGYFSIIENLIFLNQSGICKVWLNRNLQLLHPQTINQTRILRNEKTMIQKTISIVQSHLNQNNCIKFSQFVFKTNPKPALNFKNTKVLLMQYYKYASKTQGQKNNKFYLLHLKNQKQKSKRVNLSKSMRQTLVNFKTNSKKSIDSTKNQQQISSNLHFGSSQLKRIKNLYHKGQGIKFDESQAVQTIWKDKNQFRDSKNMTSHHNSLQVLQKIKNPNRFLDSFKGSKRIYGSNQNSFSGKTIGLVKKSISFQTNRIQQTLRQKNKKNRSINQQQIDILANYKSDWRFVRSIQTRKQNPWLQEQLSKFKKKNNSMI